MANFTTSLEMPLLISILLFPIMTFLLLPLLQTIRSANKNKLPSGFTLIELIMVILLLAVLAAVAIPNFQDFRTDARNEAVKGGLGNMRAAIAIARATITLKEDSNVPIYPTAIELQLNAYNGSHPILNALPLEKKRIFDPLGSGYPAPPNQWSFSTLPPAMQSSIHDCWNTWLGAVRLNKPLILSFAGPWGCCWGDPNTSHHQRGYCYNPTTGEIWANSDRNGGGIGGTENNF